MQDTQTATAKGSAYTIRYLEPEADLPRLVRLLDEIDAVDQAEDATTEEELREELAWPEGDPARDYLVIADPADPDRLVAYAVTRKASTTARAWVKAMVHPDWRRQGLGSALLERAIASGRARGATYIATGTDNRQPQGAPFLLKHGFKPQAIWVDMRAGADVALPEAELPVGYTLRTYAEVGDPKVLLEAWNRGFIGHFQHREQTLEEVIHGLRSPHLRPEGIFLAYGPAGDLAGFCTPTIDEELAKRRGEPTGYIDSLGVLPEHRRRGLARALLLHTMAWLRGQGMGPIELDAWAHNELALPLYYNTGFQVVQSGESYRLDF